jgi:hypothetical protein
MGKQIWYGEALSTMRQIQCEGVAGDPNPAKLRVTLAREICMGREIWMATR